MLQYSEGTRYMVLTRILLRSARQKFETQLEIDLKQGFNRIG